MGTNPLPVNPHYSITLFGSRSNPLPTLITLIPLTS